MTAARKKDCQRLLPKGRAHIFLAGGLMTCKDIYIADKGWLEHTEQSEKQK
jgi:hypothetical protein|tara:strand:- start:254 stop:406 length:153 start_codon:yes stop_codon:yes gene_type:complete